MTKQANRRRDDEEKDWLSELTRALVSYKLAKSKYQSASLQKRAAARFCRAFEMVQHQMLLDLSMPLDKYVLIVNDREIMRARAKKGCKAFADAHGLEPEVVSVRKIQESYVDVEGETHAELPRQEQQAPTAPEETSGAITLP